MSRGRRRKNELSRRSHRTAGRSGSGGADQVGTAAPRELRWAAGITVIATLHRLFFLRSDAYSDWPYSFFYEGDSETFFLWARSILSGETYDLGLPFHPPGFAYFLAGVHDLLGAGSEAAVIPHLAVRSLCALLGGVTVGLLYLLVRPYLGHWCALLTAVLATYHFGLYVLSVSPVTEVLYLTLLMVVLLVYSRGLVHPLSVAETVKRPLLSGSLLGILLGLLALTRAESLLLALLLTAVGVFGADRDLSAARRYGPWVLVGLGWILAVSPWALLNHRNLTGLNEDLGAELVEPLPTFVPLTIYGPMNLALANHDGADGTFSRDLMSSQKMTGRLELTDPQHLEFILHGDRMAREWIIGHPGAFVRLVGARWWLTAQAWSLGWSQWNWPGGWVGLRRPVDMFAPDSKAGMIFLPAALVGFFLAFRAGGRPRRFVGLVVLLATVVAVSTGMFFGYIRQGMLLMPFALSGLAVSLAWVTRRGGDGSGNDLFADAMPRRAAIGLGVLVVLLFALELHGAGADRRFKATGSASGPRGKINRDLPVRLEPLP
ncbi:MAG: glycosyltransferase family 39 protein [Thermoanaerobaculia bacterium]|nr:glycosyltransferase family 39 protein [Thermoanaerobaculia bacterium]